MSMQAANSKADRLSEQVGHNVRATRQALSKPRRLLAEETGISERYIGQLETGRANISLNVLQKVADALAVPITDLMDEAPISNGPLRAFLSSLSGAQQAEAHALLSRHFRDSRPPSCGVALVGLRGAGKTTLGRRLASRLKVAFLQLSQLVAERAGMTTQELVELAGLEAFRRLEREALHNLIDEGRQVVLETSGGIVASPATYQLVLENFQTIWIKAAPEEHMQRVIDQNDLRPMAGRPTAMDDLRVLLASREQYYGQAAGVLDTSGKSEDRSAEGLYSMVGTP